MHLYTTSQQLLVALTGIFLENPLFAQLLQFHDTLIQWCSKNFKLSLRTRDNGCHFSVFRYENHLFYMILTRTLHVPKLDPMQML